MRPSRPLSSPDPGRVGRGQHEDSRKDGQDQLDDAVQVKHIFNFLILFSLTKKIHKVFLSF